MAGGTLIVLLVAVYFQSQLARATDDFRVIGGKVYDFSQVDTGGPKNPFKVEGYVQELDTNAQILTLSWSTEEINFVPREIDPYDSSAEMLRSLAQQKLVEKPISMGQYLALSPGMRPRIKRSTTVHKARIINFPLYYSKGSLLRVFGLPVEGAISTWDHGIPISAEEAHSRGHIIKAFSGVTIDEDLTKAFVRHLSQASNNMPYSQYLVALDYLQGLGTETNVVLGDYWMNRSAQAGSPEAREFRAKAKVSNPEAK